MINEQEKKLLEYVESGLDSNINYAVNNENVTINVLDRALDFVESEKTLLKIFEKYEALGFNLNGFIKIFDAEKKIDKYWNEHKIKQKIITHSLFTRDMYDYYISKIDDFRGNVKIIQELINSKYTNEESLKRIFENISKTSNYNTRQLYITMLSNLHITEEIIEEILKTKDVNDELLRICVSHPKVNSRILLLLVDFIDSEELLNLVIESPKATDDVLIRTLPKIRERCVVIHRYRVDRYSDIHSYKTIDEEKTIKYINKLLENNNVTDEVIIKIIADFPERIAKTKINTKEYLDKKAIKIALLLTSSSLTNDQIEEFFQIDNLNEDDIIQLINRYHDNNILLKSIEFPFATQKLYKEIINVLYKNQSYNLNDSQKEEMIIKLLEKELDEETLLEIFNCIESTRTSYRNDVRKFEKSIIEKVANHKNASLKIVAKINVLCDMYPKDERESMQAIAGNLKRKIISQIYQIEEEENVTEILKMNVEDRMSTMLWGPSGVGKSSRVFEIDPTATMLILKNGMLPEEVIGGKEPNGEPGMIYPPHWYKVLCEKCEREPDRMHILFIDEFTNVSDTIKNLVWEVIGNRLVNGHEEWPLPENCSIVVAGNRPEESSAVRIDAIGGVMPAPLHNRIDSMLEIKFDIDEWQKWALETDSKTGNLRIHPIVYSFCVANADKVMFTQFEPEQITQPFLSPRKWETLSKALYSVDKRGTRRHISYARIKSILGDNDITNAFISHYERIPIDMNKIVNGEYTEKDFPTIEDKLYALGMIISQYSGDAITIESFILECLGDEYLSIYENMKNLREATIKENQVQSMITRN